MENISVEEIALLKSQGFILMKDKELFTCRIVLVSGMAKADDIKKVAEISEKYAQGVVSITVRLNFEIPGIKYEDIVPMKKELEEAGLIYGGTGAKVRPLVCCKGTVCKFGMIDTQSICRELSNKFFPMDLPHKFKINITGCTNNCAKAQLNDLGFMGAPKNHVKVFIGGKFGRQSIMGEEICKIKVEDMESITEKCIEFYKLHGKKKQRFGDTLIEMNGTDEYKAFVQELKSFDDK